MDFRIIETTLDDTYLDEIDSSKVGTHNTYSDNNWYIVQYKKDPSLFNLWHPKWHNIYFNAEEFYHYNGYRPVALKPKGFYDTLGYKVYGLNNAKNLLSLYKKEYNQNAVVVYEETTKETMRDLINKYESLLKDKK